MYVLLSVRRVLNNSYGRFSFQDEGKGRIFVCLFAGLKHAQLSSIALWPQNLYLPVMNQPGHWVCSMLTGWKEGLDVKNTLVDFQESGCIEQRWVLKLRWWNTPDLKFMDAISDILCTRYRIFEPDVSGSFQSWVSTTHGRTCSCPRVWNNFIENKRKNIKSNSSPRTWAAGRRLRRCSDYPIVEYVLVFCVASTPLFVPFFFQMILFLRLFRFFFLVNASELLL